MITRLYANNFRCLVAFTAEFDSFGVLCGPNGVGKTSAFDAIQLIRNLATGDGILGGEGTQDVERLDFTNWLDSQVQEFELGITTGGHSFEYTLHIEQLAAHEKPRIIKESAHCDSKLLFERDLDGVRFAKHDGTMTGFPLDWRQAALGSIQPRGSLRELELIQEAFSKIFIVSPSPRRMEPESKGESRQPGHYLANLTSWFRSLSQEQDWTDLLRESLQIVWPDFKSFRLVDTGMNAKALQLRFGDSKSGELFFSQLSDGEKMLLGLYMIRAALDSGMIHTILIDEPDNFVGLPELQPWVLSLCEILDEDHQAILISHHPEILNSAGEDCGHYLWRDNHTSPTRIGKLQVPEGLTPGEAIARGWVNAKTD